MNFLELLSVLSVTVGWKLVAMFDTSPDSSCSCVHLVRRVACFYSHSSLCSSAESLPAEANMGTRATKFYDISDNRNSKPSQVEAGQRHWQINRNSISFHCFLSSPQNPFSHKESSPSNYGGLAGGVMGGQGIRFRKRG